MNERLTLLHSQGPLMTKVWTPEGIQPYQDARTFKVEEREVDGIRALSALLLEIEGKPRTCLIRGQFVGDVEARERLPAMLEEERRFGRKGTAPPEGMTLRRAELFPDRALSVLLIDIDNFRPKAHSTNEPEAAIGEFIRTCLPPEFLEISYHWQLSASAGAKGKEGVLKAHVWFWLKAPKTGAQLEAWAAGFPGVDKTLMRPVQIHYTARPVFREVPDPIATRSGFCEGLFDDSVDLRLSEQIEAMPVATRARRQFVDPTTKSGLIGAFCSVYGPKDLCDLCPDVFVAGSTSERITWLGGGGARDGVRVCDGGTHLYSSHNTAPTSRACNLWDFIRFHMFGHLDADMAEGTDFDISAMPSQQAMHRWVRDGHPNLVQPEIEMRSTSMHKASAEDACGAQDGRVILLRGSDVTPSAVRWVWRHWLAKGKTHILAGQAGQGKTTLALKFAAIVTSGGTWPDGTRCPPGNVVMWSSEDDASDTLVPRLRVMGGDPSRFYVVSGIRGEDDRRRPFDPANDLQELRTNILHLGSVALLVLDPIVSAISGDSHKSAETRRGLQPLVDLGAESDAAVLGISHFSKGTEGRDTTERVTGSLAFAAVSRIVLCAAKVRGDADDDARRVLARTKSNIGPDDGGFEYFIEQRELQGFEDVRASCVRWGNSLTGSARELITEKTQIADRTADHPEEFVRRCLIAGPMDSSKMYELGSAEGLSPRQIGRARKRLGAKHEKVGMKGPWRWSLPVVEYENFDEGDEDDMPFSLPPSAAKVGIQFPQSGGE